MMKKFTYILSLFAVLLVFSSFSDDMMSKKEKKEKAKTEKVKSDPKGKKYKTAKSSSKRPDKVLVEDTITNPVWVFGFSASFTDSIIYMTDLQRIPDAKITKKTKFLQGSSDLSSQMKYYLEDNLKMKNRTCAIFFNTKKEQLEKKYVEVRKKYMDQTHLTMKYLNANEFQFTKPEE